MKAQEFLNNRADHHIRFLFKFSLAMLEDLKNTHEINFNKLKKNLPDEYEGIIDMSNYLDEPFYQLYRKKVLDVGNSVLRDYNNELANLTVEFKFKD
jgi:hypothetical protein